MRTSSDTKRPRSVKAEFDPDFRATPVAGAVLAEKTMRSLRITDYIGDYLPARSLDAQFSTMDCVWAITAGMLLGGQGMQAAEVLRWDPDAAQIFGLAQGVPSPSTIYRALCDLSGLVERAESDCYEAAGKSSPSLDMFGQDKKVPQLHRVVADEPEAAEAARRAALDEYLLHAAMGCLRRMHRQTLQVSHWTAVFMDATDLQVDGNCFDAARMGREGKKILRLLTCMTGPIVTSAELCEGSRDEGAAMPAVLERGARALEAVGRKTQRVLALMDAAYFERQVVEALDVNWDFIVCANQQRDSLVRLANEQLSYVWANTGADASRGWSASQVCCFTHLVAGWREPVTIVARRWQDQDEVDGVWHYSFLATRLTESDLPKKMLREHGYSMAIWMLYSTKQGRENHYKTPLRDFGLHHPPSGRLGVDQAYYALGLAASNIAMVIRYRVLAQPDRAMAFWRVRETYFRVAGYLVRGGRYLTVRLAGASVGAQRQVLWRSAFAAAAQL